MKSQIFFSLLLFGLIAYVAVNRNLVSWLKIVSTLAFCCAIFVVWWPYAAIQLANAFGVGRGVDFFIYLAFVGVSFLVLGLQAKVRRLERVITELARAIAISGAERNDNVRKGPL
ncbi:hypothetical protein AU476_16435 [Cupriavidus sp. UYMSc13B]|nr:hypothetical protein AU476_16435 [Cupriavidus sp. UYMSc13B]